MPKVVILPNKIDYSNFTQGNIGDCYFIGCVNALCKIPQLLNFIMGLTSEEMKNEVNNDIFMVKLYIDGIWETIYVRDSFPAFNINLPNKKALVGVKPKENELFMMILEKAWAKINGGYDRIFGGRIMKIYELFLGCTCNYLDKDNDQNLFEEIRKNENNFGTLSLCSAPYLTNAVNISGKINHAYTIVKTLEIYPKNNKEICQTCQFLILSNPHGKNSSKNSVSIEEINEIIEKKFGINNKDQYQYIIDINNHYAKTSYQSEGTGIVYMPLEYYKKWSSYTAICAPHYDCLSYMYNLSNELEYLYIFKIHLKEKQFFTCQICFQSDRAHTNGINGEKDYKLYDNICGIKIIKNDEYFTKLANYNSEESDYKSCSIKELNTSLENGDYFIMIYLESKINKGIVRFLVDKEIEILTINKFDILQKDEDSLNNCTEKQINFIKYIINKNKSNIIYNLFNNQFEKEYYKLFLNSYINEILITCKKKYFLPGIKEYFSHFKELAERKNLRPEEAIFSISKEGETTFYDIIDPFTLNKVYGERIKKGEKKVI